MLSFSGIFTAIHITHLPTGTLPIDQSNSSPGLFNFRLTKTNHLILKMAASAQVVETSVTKNRPSNSQDSSHPDDLFQSRYVTPGFKPSLLDNNNENNDDGDVDDDDDSSVNNCDNVDDDNNDVTAMITTATMAIITMKTMTILMTIPTTTTMTVMKIITTKTKSTAQTIIITIRPMRTLKVMMMMTTTIKKLPCKVKVAKVYQ